MNELNLIYTQCMILCTGIVGAEQDFHKTEKKKQMESSLRSFENKVENKAIQIYYNIIRFDYLLLRGIC